MQLSGKLLEFQRLKQKQSQFFTKMSALQNAELPTILAIQNYGASGTTLLHSLFDGHPSILTLPGLTGITFYATWRGAILNNPSKPLPLETVLTFMLQWFNKLYDINAVNADMGLRELGPDRDDSPCVDRGEFFAYFHARVSRLLLSAGLPEGIFDESRQHLYRKSILIAIYEAYQVSRGLTPVGARYLLFPAHSFSVQELEDLFQDFPGFRLIYMVRDPIANMNSILKWNSLSIQNKTVPLDTFRVSISQLLVDEVPQLFGYGYRTYSLTRHPSVRSDICCAVRLEDLHANGRPVLESLMRWLDLPWDDCLLTSTFSGKLWWNRPHTIRVCGMNQSMLPAGGYDRLSRFDAARVGALSFRIRSLFDYQKSAVPVLSKWILLASCVLPFQAELTRYAPYRRIEDTIWIRARGRGLPPEGKGGILMQWLATVKTLALVTARRSKEYIAVRWLMVRSLVFQHKHSGDYVALFRE